MYFRKCVGLKNTDGEAPCIISAGFQDAGESLSELGRANNKPDLAVKLSLLK